MKLRSILLGILVLHGASGAAIAGACSREFILGWTDIPPVFTRDEQGEAGGMDIEIIDAVFDRLGCRYQAVYMPFKRYVTSLRFGSVDIVLSGSFTKEREEYVYYSPPYRREKMALFLRKDKVPKQPIRNVAALAASDLVIAGGLGMWLGDRFQNQIETNQAFRQRTLFIDGYPAMVRALANRRMDGIVGDTISINHILENQSLTDRIAQQPLILHDNDVHIMFSKQSVAMDDVVVISKTLIEFAGTPEHLAILGKYTPNDPAGLLPRGMKPRAKKPAS